MPIDPKELARCLEVLEAARELAPDDPDYLRLEQAVAHLVKTGKKKRRLARKRASRAEDLRKLGSTGLARARRIASAQAPDGTVDTRLNRQRACYVCKQPYREVHPYFHTMCRACGDLCASKRNARADLRGRRALVTGGRIKIGFAVALKLLRDGAEVHVTTRFPKDAARRFAAEADSDDWRDRLRITGADFRMLPAFFAQVAQWVRGPAFDILINNAAQTVWHPPEYYLDLLAGEAAPFDGPAWITSGLEPRAPSVATPNQLSQALFPAGERDEYGNPLDLRRENSWVKHLGEIDPVEMIEVQVVNNIAPFVLCSELRPNMMRSSFDDRYIVNVTAVEGQFARDKSPRHPHTNMAKAALNMLTRTSAADYEADGIYMTSVDPGWMSHEGPHHFKERAAARGFHPPLEAIDCAARVYDPIVRGLAGERLAGVLLKDFRLMPW